MKNISYLLLTIACVVLLSFSNNVSAAPMTWSTNGHDYDVIFLSGSSWDAARTNAQSLGIGWDLATITSSDEQVFINGLLNNLSSPPETSTGVVQYWIGGFQPPASVEPDGSWQWINSEGLFWDQGPVPGVYANWGGPGEPNDSGGQNHLALDSRYGWKWDDNDHTLDGYVFGYVAEKSNPSNSVPEPSTLLLLGSGLGLAGVGLLRNKLRK